MRSDHRQMGVFFAVASGGLAAVMVVIAIVLAVPDTGREAVAWLLGAMAWAVLAGSAVKVGEDRDLNDRLEAENRQLIGECATAMQERDAAREELGKQDWMRP